MIELKNVSAGYNGVEILHDVSFQVRENISIIGPNGCGKTTLLKTIANIIPYAGEIIVNGKSIRDMIQAEISLNIAMLSQQHNIYFSYSVFDTVMMGRYLKIKSNLLDYPTKEDKAVVTQVLKAVDLLDVKDRDITKLSGGQLQRVFLARTLAQEPNIILLDEPTNHMDIKCQVEIINYLKQWSKKENKLVVGVMHDINLAMELSNRVILMKNGKIVANEIAEEMIKLNVIDTVYEMDVKRYMQLSLSRWINA